MTFPSRDDIAMETIIGECGDAHDFEGFRLEPSETRTGWDGRTFDVRRDSCRRCGSVRVSQWSPPDPGAVSGVICVGATVVPPEQDAVPGLAERALRMTDEEYAAALAARGFPEGVPAGFAPDRRATAVPESLDFTVRVRAGQFALLDRGGSLSAVLPLSPGARSAGGLIDAVPGAVLFWAPVHDGDFPLSVLISPTDPGADRSYPDMAMLSCRFRSGHVALQEIAGRAWDLPPLPAGHGVYRLRLHIAGTRGLLHIWHRPRDSPPA